MKDEDYTYFKERIDRLEHMIKSYFSQDIAQDIRREEEVEREIFMIRKRLTHLEFKLSKLEDSYD